MAGEPAAAVEIWFAHQDEEIMAGQAAAADEVFGRIHPDQLDGSQRAELLVIRNRLALLAGEAERVLADMESFSWEHERRDSDGWPSANRRLLTNCATSRRGRWTNMTKRWT